ncbi:hypothetical protein [Citreimonas salinaria]|uniref:Uncharacterized protein n=1 Tax=Citreimonas salinaria TaxID=321339 RepID=A0A1H3LMN3_9RHOB|nr:hypothetical protein [Citreimonas salinaria]SDY65115.1 hypothetical protein SAMN05444340_11376 [Citreimonas salinaria]
MGTSLIDFEWGGVPLDKAARKRKKERDTRTYRGLLVRRSWTAEMIAAEKERLEREIREFLTRQTGGAQHA